MKRPLPLPAIGAVVLLLLSVLAYAFVKSSGPAQAGIGPEASKTSPEDIAKMKARDHASEGSKSRK